MITITFFGQFTLSDNTTLLTARDSSAKRLFRALAYLSVNRRRAIDVCEFHRFLHDGKDIPYTPELVKVTLYRLRKLLTPISPDSGIRLKNNLITLFPNEYVRSDADDFSELADKFVKSGDLVFFQNAISLYRGRYLAEFLGESFTMPNADSYHRRYLSLLDAGLTALWEEGALDTLEAIADAACALDPYAETPQYYRILAIDARKDRLLARALFHSFRERYQTAFHLSPSPRFSALEKILQA